MQPPSLQNPTCNAIKSSSGPIPQGVLDAEKSGLANVQTSPVHDTLSKGRIRIRLASAFFALLTLGWGDGVTGTLLPYFKRDFDLSFMTSSLLFVISALGAALGTIFIEYLTGFLGRSHFSANRTPTVFAFPLSHRWRKDEAQEQDAAIVAFSASRGRFLTLVIASILHSIFFVIMGTKSGFPSMLVAYALSAFARSFILATLNVYVSSVSKRGLGYMYGTWAVGAFGAPLVCQSIIATGIRWANFYYGSLVLSALNTSLIIYAYRPTLAELQHDADFAWSLMRSGPLPSPEVLSTMAATVPESHTSPTQSTAYILPKKRSIGPHTYSTALKKPKMWASAFFAMLYNGSEASTQGYIVIYLLGVRNANPNTVGYVTSGFWGGMAISRLTWGYLSGIITFRQRKWIIQGCIFLAFCMHLCIWFVPSFIENAVSTAIVGLMYGPVYPANLGIARDLLPTEVHLVSLAIVAAFGSFGTALFPFITGTLSTYVGPHTLPYITVSQCVALFSLWTLFPSQLPDAL